MTEQAKAPAFWQRRSIRAAAVMAVAAMTLLVFGPIGGSSAQDSQSCTGDYVLGTGSPAFGGTANRLYANTNSPGWVTQRTYDISATPVPAGEYEVNAVAYDGYFGRENVFQEFEIWHASFMDTNGATLATTASTGDVPDLMQEAWWSGGVGSIVLGAEATSLTLYHDFLDNTIPHSVEPICLGLSIIEQPIDTTTTTEGPSESTTTTAAPETPTTTVPTRVEGKQETPTAQPVTAQPDFTG